MACFGLKHEETLSEFLRPRQRSFGLLAAGQGPSIAVLFNSKDKPSNIQGCMSSGQNKQIWGAVLRVVRQHTLLRKILRRGFSESKKGLAEGSQVGGFLRSKECCDCVGQLQTRKKSRNLENWRKWAQK